MAQYITNYQYYQNGGVMPEDANHGSYQYISLADIINNYELFYVGDDKEVDNVAKSTIRFHSKQAVKQLNYDAFKSTRVLETTIGSDLKLVFPHDYVNWIRISKEENGTLFTLHENQSSFSAESYLKDNNNELLFDGNGEVLYGTSILDQERLSAVEDTSVSTCNSYRIGGKFGMDPTKAQGNPLFRINRRAGVIDFDSNMRDKLVVIEYISDGMEGGVDADIVVNKFFEKYLYAYMNYEILNNKRNIPAVTVQKAMRKKTAEYNNAKIRISDLHPSKLLMTLRGQDKWIK